MNNTVDDLGLRKQGIRVLIPTRSKNIKIGPKLIILFKSKTKTIYSSFLHFESVSDFNKKLLAYPFSFPTSIITHQFDSRSPIYDLHSERV